MALNPFVTALAVADSDERRFSTGRSAATVIAAATRSRSAVLPMVALSGSGGAKPSDSSAFAAAATVSPPLAADCSEAVADGGGGIADGKRRFNPPNAHFSKGYVTALPATPDGKCAVEINGDSKNPETLSGSS